MMKDFSAWLRETLSGLFEGMRKTGMSDVSSKPLEVQDRDLKDVSLYLVKTVL